eukprot:gene247-59542_t
MNISAGSIPSISPKKARENLNALGFPPDVAFLMPQQIPEELRSFVPRAGTALFFCSLARKINNTWLTGSDTRVVLVSHDAFFLLASRTSKNEGRPHAIRRIIPIPKVTRLLHTESEPFFVGIEARSTPLDCLLVFAEEDAVRFRKVVSALWRHYQGARLADEPVQCKQIKDRLRLKKPPGYDPGDMSKQRGDARNFLIEG